MIISHTDPTYKRLNPRVNGALVYSREICANIIPNIKTDRNWLTINTYDRCPNHTIVFIHNNKEPKNYDWLKSASDLVLVCGIPETAERMKHLGRTIYLPLSVDIKTVEQYRTEKTRDTAYAGRIAKISDTNLPENVERIARPKRDDFLREMAKYRKSYAVGRCAIEAKILGCEILPFDPRFPDPERWKILDNSEAVPILQKELDKIDGVHHG